MNSASLYRDCVQRGRSRKHVKGLNRLRLQQGVEWPQGIVVQTETVPANVGAVKAGIVIVIVLFCIALIAVLTVHAMAMGNQRRLDGILGAAWKVLIGLGLWAVAALPRDRILSAVRKALHPFKE